MAIPQIDLLPPPPLPTDQEDIFDAKAGASLTAQQAMVPQINTSLTWIGQQVTAVDGYRQAAGTSAQNAADSATIAQQQAAAAATAKQGAESARDAAQAAAAAAGSAAGLPSLTGNANKFLGVNAAGTLVGWFDAGQKVGDVLMTGRNLDASYLSMNGGIYLQSAYPALFAVLGLIGGDVGVSWTQTSTFSSAVTKIVRGPNGTLIGILSGGNQAIFRSTDNGQNWSAIGAGVSTSGAVDIDTDGNGKWLLALSAAIGSSTLRVSTDDGLTWAEGPATANTTVKIVRYLGNSIWVGGGNTSSMLRSTNNGATWAIGGGLPTVNSTSVLITDRAGTAIIYSTGTGAFRTIDGFATAPASLSGSGFSSTAAVAFATDNSGTWIGVGGAGAAQRSLDNGATWSAFTSGVSVALSAASTNGKGVWLLGGASGTLRRSKDNLNTFDTISPLNAAVQTLVQTDTLAVAGTVSAIYRSVPAYSYDTATQFRVPQQLSTPQGLNSYIKAKVAA